MRGFPRQRPGVKTLITLLFVPAAAVVVGMGTAGAAATCGRIPSDFNGDGHADVAVGEPFRAVGGNQLAGDMRVMYGAAAGVTTTGNQYFDGASFSGVNLVGPSAKFGAAWASGYFDSDCFADLAIGVTGTNPGRVIVVNGSATGLNASKMVTILGSQLEQQTTGADGFGSALAVGDFNGDGRSDLAIATKDAAEPGHPAIRAGGAGVVYGSATGLTMTGAKWFTQDTGAIPGASENGDRFGSALAAGDFNGDGRADLAVGAPGESFGVAEEGGAVTVIPGSASGLTATGSQFWSQDSAGVPETAEDGDFWGSALAAGDFNKDGRADLAVGDPEESIGSLSAAGSVTVLRGSAAGLTGTGSQLWSQNSAGAPGSSEAEDLFGSWVATGDLNGDGRDDLVAGVEGEAIGSLRAAGGVSVFYGSASGVTSAGAQFWSQDSPGVAGAAESDDMFGQWVGALRIATTARADLVVSIPAEDSSGFINNGGIAVLRGGAAGLTASGNQFFDAAGLLHGAQTGAEFGANLG